MTEDENSTLETRRCDTANGLKAAEARANAALLKIARLIGRQIAREEFERRLATSGDQPAPRAEDDKQPRDPTR